MHDSHMLTRHNEIRNWVCDRQGIPAIARIRDRFGAQRAQLRLSFQRKRRGDAERVKVDDGMSPVSWTAWLAELDRQNLALKVSAGPEPDFEFVERHDAN